MTELIILIGVILVGLGAFWLISKDSATVKEGLCTLVILLLCSFFVVIALALPLTLLYIPWMGYWFYAFIVLTIVICRKASGPVDMSKESLGFSDALILCKMILLFFADLFFFAPHIFLTCIEDFGMIEGAFFGGVIWMIVNVVVILLKEWVVDSKE